MRKGSRAGARLVRGSSGVALASSQLDHSLKMLRSLVSKTLRAPALQCVRCASTSAPVAATPAAPDSQTSRAFTLSRTRSRLGADPHISAQQGPRP